MVRKTVPSSLVFNRLFLLSCKRLRLLLSSIRRVMPELQADAHAQKKDSSFLLQFVVGMNTNHSYVDRVKES